MPAMDRARMARYAAEWAADFGARDLERILGHYAEDVRFESPVAQRVAGQAVLTGKAALRAYFAKALSATRSIAFEIEELVCDEAAGRLAILYRSTIDGERRQTVCETVRFDADGLVAESRVYYGAAEGANSSSR